MPKLNRPRKESSTRVSDFRAAMRLLVLFSHILDGFALSDGYADANSGWTADDDSRIDGAAGEKSAVRWARLVTWPGPDRRLRRQCSPGTWRSATRLPRVSATHIAGAPTVCADGRITSQ